MRDAQAREQEAIMKTSRKILSLMVIMIAVLPAAYAVAEPMPTVDEILDKYTQALDSTASFIDQYEKTGKFSGHFPPGHPMYSLYGNQRFKYDTFERGVHKFKVNQGYYKQEYKWGYFNQSMINIPADKPISRLWIKSGTLDYFHQVNKVGHLIDRVERFNTTRPEIPIPTSTVGISHILGYVDADERMDTVLRKADRVTLRSKTEKVGDTDCFVVDADTKYGRCLIWIDPEHGYHAARIRHRAEEGQYLHRDIVPEGSFATGYYEVLRFEQIDNTWVPFEVKAGFHRTVGGPEYYMDEEAVYKRTKILVNPDHGELGSFSDPVYENPANDPELENGTLVKDNDKEYIWEDGKLVPKEESRG